MIVLQDESVIIDMHSTGSSAVPPEQHADGKALDAAKHVHKGSALHAVLKARQAEHRTAGKQSHEQHAKPGRGCFGRARGALNVRRLHG